MRYLHHFIVASLLLFLSSATVLAAGPTRPLTVELPDTAIKELIHKALPVQIPIESQLILGSVSIDAIQNIKLHENRLSGHVTLSGHKLNVVTEIAGHALRMKIGSLTMAFRCDATVRFDPKTQRLYVKPVISELQSTDRAKTEVASLISQLFNGQEFPLRLDRLRPLSGDAGNKTLHIAMRVQDVAVQPGAIQIQAVPTVSATQKK